jgi:hypothetical protein
VQYCFNSVHAARRRPAVHAPKILMTAACCWLLAAHKCFGRSGRHFFNVLRVGGGSRGRGRGRGPRPTPPRTSDTHTCPAGKFGCAPSPAEQIRATAGNGSWYGSIAAAALRGALSLDFALWVPFLQCSAVYGYSYSQ